MVDNTDGIDDLLDTEETGIPSGAKKPDGKDDKSKRRNTIIAGVVGVPLALVLGAQFMRATGTDLGDLNPIGGLRDLRGEAAGRDLPRRDEGALSGTEDLERLADTFSYGATPPSRPVASTNGRDGKGWSAAESHDLRGRGEYFGTATALPVLVWDKTEESGSLYDQLKTLRSEEIGRGQADRRPLTTYEAWAERVEYLHNLVDRTDNKLEVIRTVQELEDLDLPLNPQDWDGEQDWEDHPFKLAVKRHVFDKKRAGFYGAYRQDNKDVMEAGPYMHITCPLPVESPLSRARCIDDEELDPQNDALYRTIVPFTQNTQLQDLFWSQVEDTDENIEYIFVDRGEELDTDQQFDGELEGVNKKDLSNLFYFLGHSFIKDDDIYVLTQAEVQSISAGFATVLNYLTGIYEVDDESAQRLDQKEIIKREEQLAAATDRPETDVLVAKFIVENYHDSLERLGNQRTDGSITLGDIHLALNLAYKVYFQLNSDIRDSMEQYPYIAEYDEIPVKNEMTKRDLLGKPNTDTMPRRTARGPRRWFGLGS